MPRKYIDGFEVEETTGREDFVGAEDSVSDDLVFLEC